MNEEKLKKLEKYLIKKGMTIDYSGNDHIDVSFTNFIKFTIRLHLYRNRITYGTLIHSPEYPYKRNKKGRLIGESINRLKTSFDRVDLNGAVFSNILKIKKWLDPIAKREKKLKEDITEYAKELEFYFIDKYGNVDLEFSNDRNGKRIFARITTDIFRETHQIFLKNGKYFMVNVHTSFRYDKEPIVYKQREKKL